MFLRTFLFAILALLGLAGCGGGPDLVVTGGVTVKVVPESADLKAGESRLFQATVLGTSDRSVTWKATAGTIDAATGLFTAPLAAGDVVVVATSVAQPSRSGSATVHVAAPLDRQVIIVPPSTPVAPMEPRLFQAIVVDANGFKVPDQRVSWSLLNAPVSGTVDAATGFYVAPTTPGVYTLTATSVEQPAKVGFLRFGVVPSAGVQVLVSPDSLKLPPKGFQRFVASVSGTSNTGVTWRVLEGSAGGSFLDQDGLYQAPPTPGTYTIMATSLADGSKSGAATVTVTYEVLPIVVAIVPGTKSLAPNATFTFAATVSGTAQTGVTWRVDSGPGTIDAATGLYTAPSGPGTAVIRATSTADPTRFALATVTITRSYVTLSPTGPQVMIPGDTRTFTGVVFGPDNQPLMDQRLQWSQVLPSSTPGVMTSAPYLYTAPLATGTALLRATSLADPTAFADIPIQVTPTALTLNPSSALLAVTRSLQFTASSPTVLWSVNGVAGGSVSVTGFYQAPTIIGGALSFMTDTVTATFAPNPTVLVSAKVLVTPLLVLPERATQVAGDVITLTASTVGVGNTACNWTAVLFPGGTAQPEDVSSGLGAQGAATTTFTVPNRSGTYRIRAVPTSSPTYYGEAEILVK